MRPDRIIVGEVRGAEALDMLQALNTGHDGSLSTVHANSAPDALTRLETLVLLADVGLPLGAVRAQMASAVDAVVHVARRRDGRRSIEAIGEVVVRDERPTVELLYARRGDDVVALQAPTRPARRPEAPAPRSKPA
jgi:pilus assembly protein CpaF